MIVVERISSPAEFGRIGDDWDGLLEASGADHIHLTHAWLSAWAETLGRGKEILVLKASEDGKPLGYAPLAIERTRLHRLIPYKRILFLGDPQSDIADFLIARNRPQVLEAIFASLRRIPGWGEIILHAIPQTSPNFELLRAAGGDSGICTFSPHSRCYFIKIGGRSWDEFYEGTSKGAVRKDVRRLKNHYARLSWTLQEWNGADPAAALSTVAGLHAKSQIRKGRESAYGGREFRAFMEAVVRLFAGDRRIRLFFLNIADRPVSFILGFDYRRTFYWWNTGFDPAFKNISPTKFLLFQVLQKAFEERLWDEFNFMRGGSAYKRDWTSSFFELYQLRIRNRRGLPGLLNRARRPAVSPAGPGPACVP